MLPNTSALMFGRLSGTALTRASQPHASRRPMFAICEARKPPVTGYWRAYKASSVFRAQRVKAKDVRSCHTPNSAPTSVSVEISGRRSGFPRFAGTSPLPVGPVSGAYVVSLSNALGWRPALPMAARTRSVERYDERNEVFHAARSLGMIEIDACGYHTPSELLPKALL